MFIILAVFASAAGCSKEEAKQDKPAAKAPAKTPAKTVAAPAKKASSADAVHGVMKHYEACRVLLAGDKGEGIAACAEGMSEAAKAAESDAPESSKAHFVAVAAAADALAGEPADDLGKLRLAYGKVSEPVVALLTATPAAAKDYHVFECPMAAGYKLWAQPTDELSNPYMGTKMLKCGGEVHVHHQGMMKDGDTKGGAKKDDHMKGGGGAMDHKGAH
jgi:hypothetical protein